MTGVQTCALPIFKHNGIAQSVEEFTPGIVGLAVPVLTEAGEPIAAINVAMPAVRYDEQSRAKALDALNNAKAILNKWLA